MKVKDFALAILFSLIFAGIVIGNMTLFGNLTNSVNWMIFSCFISLSEFLIIVKYVFPKVFDCIEVVEKEEMKNA